MSFIKMIRRLSFALFCASFFAGAPFFAPAEGPEPALEDLSFFERDTDYYESAAADNLNLIYSADLKDLASVFAESARRAEAQLSKDFKRPPIFKKSHIYFPSARWQVPNASASIYPLPFISIYPSGGPNFIDQLSMFRWLNDVLIHEMTHIYQLSQNSRLDRALFWLLGPLAYRNMFLGNWMLEGSAVFNESLYGYGGRLFSGWVRAFVFAQLKKGLSLKALLKPYNDPFANMGKYFHGGYFFAYLRSRYGGPKAVNNFFSESGRFFPADFYGLRASLKRAYGADLETLFKDYKKRWGALAGEQKSSPSKALLRSKAFAPMNSDEGKIYFLISDIKSPPRLAIFDKQKRKFKTIKKDLPIGKVFYKNGEYLSADSARTSSVSFEYSLFREGIKPVKKYNSQYVMDFYKDQYISLDTRKPRDQSALLLNGAFYDTSDSSAIMDHKGRIYYFKQEGDRRVLYRDKLPLTGFKSYYGYPVEADERGLYFIGAVRRGSGLFVYREAERAIFRLGDLDAVGYARKIKGNEFLISEIGPESFEYKIISAKEIPEQPFLYEYSFKKKNLFEGPAGETAARAEALGEKGKGLSGGGGTAKEKEGERLSGGGGTAKEKEGDELSLSALESLAAESESLSFSRLKEREAQSESLLAFKSAQPARSPAGEEDEKPPVFKKSRTDQSFLGQKPLAQPKAYSPLSQLSLRQAVFFSSLDPYFISFFRFLDPLQWSELAFFNSLGSQRKYFNLFYAYRKYRPSLELSLIYSESRLDWDIHKHRIQTLRDIGFLETEDVFDRIPLTNKLKKKDYIFERLRALDFSWSFPLARRAYWNLSWINSLQLGQRQFNNDQRRFPLFYEAKNWKDYIQHNGKLRYSFKRRYRYGYSSHKERLFQLSYNIMWARAAPGAYNVFLSGRAKARWAEELGKEWFIILSGLAERGLWSKDPQSPLLKTEGDVLSSYSSFKRAAQSLYQLDFQILKALNHSFYPLKAPFWLRRWAPLAGFSALAMELEGKKSLQRAFIPFAGIEAEMGFLSEKIGFKAGFSGEYVFLFPGPSPRGFQISAWLKRNF